MKNKLYHVTSSEEAQKLEERMKILEDNCSFLHKGGIVIKLFEETVVISPAEHGKIEELGPNTIATSSTNLILYKPETGLLTIKIGDYKYNIYNTPQEI